MDLPTALMAPPHGNSQSNDLHATRDYSTKTASSKRPSREPEFHQRLDRHGKPSGERISASLVSTRGPKNKLTPSLGKTEQYRKRPIDTEVETEDNIRFPAQRQTSPINRTNDRIERRLEGCPLPVQHSPPYSTVRTRNSASHKKRRRQIFPPNSSENQRQVHEGDSTRMEGTNNGHNRERGLPRTPLMPTAPDSQSLPNAPSMEAVMEELREVTYQYTNCPDPVESAARRQQVLDGEVHGLMEETASRIIAAALRLSNTTKTFQSHKSPPRQRIELLMQRTVNLLCQILMSSSFLLHWQHLLQNVEAVLLRQGNRTQARDCLLAQVHANTT
ncbi:hypothetical protein YC2023_009794 [Brassica napus]